MKIIFNRIKKEEFIYNVFTLFTGHTLAQTITILLTPIITRLYTPEDLGGLALFTSILTFFSINASLRYDQAIILPKKEKDSINILILSIIIILCTTFFVSFVIFFWRINIAKALNNPNISYWLWFIPFGLILRGLFIILNLWALREKKFSKIAISHILQNFTKTSFQIIIVPIIGAYMGGLIFGQLIGILISVLFLSIIIINKDFFSLLKNISKINIKRMAFRYHKFPLYSVPAEGLYNLSNQLPIWLLGYFFSPAIVGFYNLGNKVIRLPISLIGQSIRQVYFKKAAEFHAENKKLNKIFLKSSLGLFCIGIIPFGILFFFGDQIFSVIFGQNWKIAGDYVQILAPFLFLQFINAPAKRTYDVLLKQNYIFFLRIFLAIFTFLSISIGYYYFNSAEKALLFLSFTGIIYNILLIGYGYYLSLK